MTVKKAKTGARMATGHRVALAVLTAGLLLAGCSAKRAATASAPEPMQLERQQVWQLVSIGGKEVSRTKHIITLCFNPEAMQINGHGPCNEFSASYRLGSPSVGNSTEGLQPIRVENLERSDVQCPEGGANAEERHLSLLVKADAYQATPLTLTLFRKGKALLKYELQ